MYIDQITQIKAKFERINFDDKTRTNMAKRDELCVYIQREERGRKSNEVA